MESNKTSGRIAGLLFLIIFISGVIIYQVLQGPVLFSDGFLTKTADHSSLIILSTLLGIGSGLMMIAIAVVLLPIVKLQSSRLGYAYLVMCVLNFLAIAIDNLSVYSLLELSQQYVASDSSDQHTLAVLGQILYKKHWWTHYSALLMSCFPVFVLYLTFYITRLIPRPFSIVGMFAATLMCIEIVASIFGNGISMNMMLPLGIVQLSVPVWLMVKGFRSE